MQIIFNCKSGSHLGKKFEFNDPVVTLGREQSSMIRFDSAKEPRVSADHCEVFLRDGKYYVRDKGSMNGTMVNGAPITTPTLLCDGAILKLGDKGPEFTINIKRADNLDGTLVNTLSDAQALPAATPIQKPFVVAPVEMPQKKLIGENTLEGKLFNIKEEARKEQSRKSKRVNAVFAGILALIVLTGVITALVYSKHEKRFSGLSEKTDALQERQDQIEIRVAKNEKEWDGNIKIVTDSIRDAQNEMANLEKKLDDQKKSLGAHSDAFALARKQIGEKIEAQKNLLKKLQGNLQDYQNNNEAMLQKVAEPFNGYDKKFGRAVYSIALQFEENGKPQTEYIASAFAICADPGLLATCAHTAKGLEALMRRSGYEARVICGASPSYNYRITKVCCHPGYEQSNSSTASADVAILTVDLQTENNGRMALPDYLHGATNEELDAIDSGRVIAMLGFPDLKSKDRRQDVAEAGLPTLISGIVSSTQSFSGMPAIGHEFEFLQHTCFSWPGNSGSPLLSAAGKVVAIQNSGAIARKISGALDPVSLISHAINIRFLRELLARNYPQVLWN